MKENTTVQTKRKLKCAWKVQCNCGIIYNFESCSEKKPNKKKHANTIDECIPVIWDGQCFQLNGTMKEMHSSLCSRLMVFRFRFWSYQYCVFGNGLQSNRRVKWIKNHWLFPVHIVHMIKEWSILITQSQAHMQRHQAFHFFAHKYINREIRHRIAMPFRSIRIFISMF